MTAAVRAQVHDDAGDAALGFEFVDEARDVARRARVILVAAAARREVLVEARHRDHADLVGVAVEGYLEDRLLRGLLLELDLVARELDRLLG